MMVEDEVNVEVMGKCDPPRLGFKEIVTTQFFIASRAYRNGTHPRDLHVISEWEAKIGSHMELSD